MDIDLMDKSQDEGKHFVVPKSRVIPSLIRNMSSCICSFMSEPQDCKLADDLSNDNEEAFKELSLTCHNKLNRKNWILGPCFFGQGINIKYIHDISIIQVKNEGNTWKEALVKIKLSTLMAPRNVFPFHVHRVPVEDNMLQVKPSFELSFKTAVQFPAQS